MFKILISTLFIFCLVGQLICTNQCTPVDLNSTETWPSLQANVQTGRRAQRDISWNVSIDQLVYFHASLSSVVFNETGYVQGAIPSIRDLLNVGVQSLIIDAYWNEGDVNWQLCPDFYPLNITRGTSTEISTSLMGNVVCDNNITLSDILGVVSSYIVSTDTDLETNIIQLHFNLHSLNNTSSPPKSNNMTSTINYSSSVPIYPSGISTPSLSPYQILTQEIANTLDNRIYTPKDLNLDRQDGNLTYNSTGLSNIGYPLQHYFLTVAKKRVLAYLNIGDTFTNLSSPDAEEAAQMFFSPPSNFSIGYLDDTTAQCLSFSSNFLSSVNSTGDLSWRTISDSSFASFTYSEINLLSDCGLSPILNHSISNLSNVMPLVSNSLWSWAPGEPAVCELTLKDDDFRSFSLAGQNATSSAYNCAILDNDGWHVEDCYMEHYALCRKGDLAYEWTISNEKVSYFDAENSCPEDTSFSIPRTALQNMAAKIIIINHIENKDVSGLPVWIDMNSISVSGCWVSGGTSATCPYRVVSRSRDAVVLLAVTAAVILIILIISSILNLDKVPIKKNRHKWKKLINKFSENEYEGVPS